MLNGARSHRHILVIIGLLLAMMVSAAKAAVPTAVPPNPHLMFPVGKPYGASYGEWSAKWWQWAASIPARDHPLLDVTGQRCGVGQSGPVWFLGGMLTSLGATTYRCTIPSDVALFLPIAHAMCAVSPGQSASEAELIACARSTMDGATNLECEVDGKPIPDLLRYRTTSPLFPLALPDDNVLGLPPGNYSPAVADGIYLMLAPLPAGQHTIRVRAVLPTVTWDVSYHLTVLDAMRVTARAATVRVPEPDMAAAVQVTWARPAQIPADAVVQYQVYRVDPGAGVPVLVGIAYEGSREVFDIVRQKTLQGYYVDTGDGVGRRVEIPLSVPGVVPGRRYRYYVQTVYRQNGSAVGGGSGTGYGSDAADNGLRISQPSPYSGLVTALAPPTATSPADQATAVDLTKLAFTWKSVEGADLYVLQVSAEPLHLSSYREVATIFNPSRAGGLTLKRQLNLIQQGFPSGAPLAWRVGATSTLDSTRPLEGYVFSNIAGFSPLSEEGKD